MTENLQKKEKVNKVNSPEQLNDYIRTSRPSTWLVVIAVVILLVSVMVWAVFGVLDTTKEVKGVAEGDKIVCYVSDVADIQKGNKVTLGDMEGEVVSISEKPISRTQAQEELDVDEYTLYCLSLNDWNYIVEVSLPENTKEGYVVANIVTESINPISFIWE